MTKVDAIWKHIEVVLCSSKPDLFKYMKQWICHMLQRKMCTVPYMQSVQGTGKSIIIDFMKAVLGWKNVLITSDAMNDVFGPFNSALKGVLLAVLEELPCASQGSWMAMNNKIKEYITGSTLLIKQKYMDTIKTDNHVSWMICTNNVAIKVPSDDRRYVCLDVSDCKKGDFAYFDELKSYMDDTKVQCAFYWHAKTIIDPNFRENNIPKTTAKKDLIVDSLPDVLQYIKEKFLCNKLGISMRFMDFYNAFCTHQEARKRRVSSKIIVSKVLTDNKIPVCAKAGNIKWIDMTKEEVYELYKSKDWIHDLDDYDDTPAVVVEKVVKKTEEKPIHQILKPIIKDDIDFGIDSDTEPQAKPKKKLIAKKNKVVKTNKSDSNGVNSIMLAFD